MLKIGSEKKRKRFSTCFRIYCLCKNWVKRTKLGTFRRLLRFHSCELWIVEQFYICDAYTVAQWNKTMLIGRFRVQDQWGQNLTHLISTNPKIIKNFGSYLYFFAVLRLEELNLDRTESYIYRTVMLVQMVLSHF